MTSSKIWFPFSTWEKSVNFNDIIVEFLLKGEDDVDSGEPHHRKETVAQDGHHDAQGDAWRGHQAQQSEHGQAAQNADAVDVAEVHLAWLQQNIIFSLTKCYAIKTHKKDFIIVHYKLKFI